MEPITGIDHIIVGVRDLESARETWRRLGFALSPRGRHFEQPTGNYCVMFPSDYVELLGIVDTGSSAHRLDSFLAWREGLMGIALAPAGSAEEARTVLLDRGLHPIRAAPARPANRAPRASDGRRVLCWCRYRPRKRRASTAFCARI